MTRSAADPYLPGHGDTSYEVIHYDLDLDYKVATNRLTGRATLTVRALVPLTSLRLDLSRLSVERVLVGGVTPRKVTPKERAVVVKLAAPLLEGDITTVEVSYRGKPQPVPGAHGLAGWEELTDGIIVASQPYGAPSFFPCNDRADDKASYTITVTTDADYRVVATGRFLGTTMRAGRTRWCFDEPAPTSSYLVSVAIGRLDEDPLPGAGDRITVVRPRRLRLPKDTPFRQLPDMLGTLENWFGPYPFQSFRAVVVDDLLDIPTEAQDMATFGTNHLVPGWDNERLVVHELAHQWFGNAVTAAYLRDIWLHEGFACYTEWLWSEKRGLSTANQWAAEHRAVLAGQEQPAPLSDPGMDHMFDDWVYKRGALMLHALRRTIGDDSFFGLARDWMARYSGSTASTADFIALASGYSQDDLQPLFSAWLDARKLPKLPRVG